MKKEYRTVKDTIAKKGGSIKKGRMPAIEGPQSGRDWIKGLKGIADPMQNNPISAIA